VYGASDAGDGQRGRIATVTDESGVELRKYDELGYISHMERTPSTQSQTAPHPTYMMDYTYDSFGRALTMGYPDGEVVTYGYNAGGLAQSVTGRKGAATTAYVTNVLYDEFGQRRQLNFGNGAQTKYTYEPLMRRLHSVDTDAGGISLQKNLYVYDDVGNVKSLQNTVNAAAGTGGAIRPGPTLMSFQYDDLYQLTNATGSYTGCANGCGGSRSSVLNLSYDEIGNIKQKDQTDVIVTGPPGSTTIPQPALHASYTYGTRPHAATGFGSQVLTYDADGNLQTSAGTVTTARTLTWDEEDRLKTEVDQNITTTFLYDADGNRTHKRRQLNETVYVNPYYVIRNGIVQTKHVMLGEQRIATTMASLATVGSPASAGPSSFFYYHPDHLQSTSYVTNQSGTLLQHDEYFASGELWFQELRNNDSNNAQPYLFNAKELDDTKLYYFGARYYDPRTSLWQSADPILADYMSGGPNGGVSRPANLGLYTYSWNNPVVVSDPDGRCPNCAAAIGGFVVGAAAGAAGRMIANGLTGQPLLKGVGAATLGGAATGALAGFTLGGSTLLAVGGGGLAAVAGGGTGRAVENGGDPQMSMENMSVDFAAGALMSGAGKLLSRPPPEEMVTLEHGSTKARVESLRDGLPDPNFMEPGADSSSGEFAMAPEQGPHPLGSPDKYAFDKASIKDFKGEGGPKVLRVRVPARVANKAQRSTGEYLFTREKGLKDLLHVWKSLHKTIRAADPKKR
jgi:RHS repeat-associated protein